MRRLILIAGLFVLGGSAVALSVKDYIVPATWRYKITVEVETPEGVKTGSAVREVTVTFIPRNDTDLRNPQYNIERYMRGEAVVVDLGKRGKVFAVQNFDDYALPFEIFKGPPGLTLEGAKFYSQLKGVQTLDRSQYPMFVGFSNLDDPTSVYLVYGNELNKNREGPSYIFRDNFETIFGNGVNIKNIFVEMTNEPVTDEITNVLPWLNNYRYTLLDGQRIQTVDAQNWLANRLGAGSFSTWENNRK